MQALVEVVVAEHKTFDAGGLISPNRCELNTKQAAETDMRHVQAEER